MMSKYEFDIPRKAVLLQAAIGGVIGFFGVFPITIVIFWAEFGPEDVPFSAAFQQVVEKVFQPPDPLLIMLGIGFAIVGSIVSLVPRLATRRDSNPKLILSEHELRKLIKEGESAKLELKSSLHWDWIQSKVNKELALVIIKTLAGFANSEGGVLLIGVDDRGTIQGLEKDYATLKIKDRDGFEQRLMAYVVHYLEAAFGEGLDVTFYRLDDKDLCRIGIEVSTQPVFVRNGREATYYLRVGNSTRALNTEEAMKHILSKHEKKKPAP